MKNQIAELKNTAKYAATVFVLTPPIFALTGYVISTMWLWFVSKPFSLPELGVANAIGLFLMCRLVTRRQLQNTEESTSSVIKEAIKTAIRLIVVLGVAWVVQKFI